MPKRQRAASSTVTKQRSRACRPRHQQFTVQDVLTWADAWHDRSGEWPIALSGEIPGANGINWLIVDQSLRAGRGGLPAESSLFRLLKARRDVVRGVFQPRLTEEQVLAWADDWRARTGGWPGLVSGDLPGVDGISWGRLNTALRNGRAGLPGGSSLARLLRARRGVVRTLDHPRLKQKQVLDWADAFHQRKGAWPKCHDLEPIPGAVSGETWRRIDFALRKGRRGLPGGSTLPRLLAARRGVRNQGDLARFSEKQILAWADAFHAREGRWPPATPDRIPEAPEETWAKVDSALRSGFRGLPGSSSLLRLLAARRGVKKVGIHHRPLSIPQILAWADAHRERTGRWPATTSGPIADTEKETWRKVHAALANGFRGLPGGSSLARLLASKRGVRNVMNLPPFRIPEVLRWADAHHARHGTWPKSNSGSIPEAPDETWLKVQAALANGKRGLPGGSSLARLLAASRGARNISDLSQLRLAEILAWADAHHARTGEWPNIRSGPIPEAPGENWQSVQSALYAGLRGLPGGSSLPSLLAKERGKKRTCRRRQADD